MFCKATQEISEELGQIPVVLVTLLSSLVPPPPHGDLERGLATRVCTALSVRFYVLTLLHPFGVFEASQQLKGLVKSTFVLAMLSFFWMTGSAGVESL